MDPQIAARAYKEDAVESAPPIKIVRMLLQAALRNIDQAAKADPKQPQSSFVESASRVDAIVVELRMALDPSADAGICEGLEQLYLFVEGRLRDALSEREVAPLVDARRVLATLLETWTEVAVEGSPGADGARDAA